MDGSVIRHRTVEVNGISMHVAEAGSDDAAARPVVLFLHGFPELWYSWRHQMEFLAARGYRCIAPDLRGYGGTTAPPDVSSYTAFHVVGDVVGLLDALGLSKVFLVGHDWGALIAWYVCLFRSERVTALVNTSVAFMRNILMRTSSNAVKPTDYFRSVCGPNYYVVRFQELGFAEKEFSRAHARFIFRQILSGRFPADEPLELGGKDTPIPPWVTEADINYYTSMFEKTDFTSAINYYRCIHRNWELAAPWASAKVQVPTKFIVGDQDITYHYPGIQDYIHRGGFKEDVPLLEEVVVIPGANHFIQQERAQQVSEIICDFISKF